MMKPLMKRLALPVFLCLLPMVLGLYLYPQLPEQIPSHWSFDGTVDGYMSKDGMVFGMPLFMASMTVFVSFMLTQDPKRRNQAGAMQVLSLWLCPVMGVLLVPLSLYIALGYDLPITVVVCGFVGVLLVIVGNYLPKSKQSYTVGIRLPWTLNSEENWNRTHRLAGKVWVIGGLALVVMACFIGRVSWFSEIFMMILVSLSLIPTGYSYHLYRKGI